MIRVFLGYFHRTAHWATACIRDHPFNVTVKSRKVLVRFLVDDIFGGQVMLTQVLAASGVWRLAGPLAPASLLLGTTVVLANTTTAFVIGRRGVF